MAADPLDQVLRLVAEGRLTADEAAPILAALDEPIPGTEAARPGRGEPPGGSGTNPSPGFGSGFGAGFGSGFGSDVRGGTGSGFGSGTGTAPDDAFGTEASGAPTSLRIEVRDNGRNVVNLRLPIGVGRFALDRVPGLSGEQVDRVREAMNTGFRGPVLVVDDGDSGVRIVLE